MSAVLEVSRLTLVRDGRALLDDVSLTVEAERIHVIVGPNGGGKSTLIEAILGETPYQGEVRFGFASGTRGQLGYVPQSFPVDPTLPVTVLELLALSRQRLPVCFGVRREVRARVAALLDRVGLAGFEGRRVGALSGGELRRVLVAQALDPSPELLLLDEPGAGLDRDSAARLERIVVEVARAGAAVLLVSHDHEQARRIADEVTWIDRRVIAEGPPSEALRGAA